MKTVYQSIQPSMLMESITYTKCISPITDAVGFLCSPRNGWNSALALQEPNLSSCAKQKDSMLQCCLVLQINPSSDYNNLKKVEVTISVLYIFSDSYYGGMCFGLVSCIKHISFFVGMLWKSFIETVEQTQHLLLLPDTCKHFYIYAH